jgi:hypothetical protein
MTDLKTPTDLKTLYEEDTAAWSKNQAAALRAAARGGPHRQIDWENLAEEIEDLGKSQRLALRSRISTIIEHLVKLAHSPATGPRNGWRQTIRRERGEIERLFEESPSLGREVPGLVQKEVKRSVAAAIAALHDRGEISPALQRALRSKSPLDSFPYGSDEVLGDWFPPVPEDGNR